MSEPLVDAHAHFFHAACGRADWHDLNAARFRAGDRMGITVHIASMLGTFGFSSPTYLPSPRDVTLGNDEMLALQSRMPERVRCYVTVNPNDIVHALEEIDRCVARGAIGLKLAASRRADDPLLDPVAEAAALHKLPVLHHIWQHRRREWPAQEASDAVELGRLAARHPGVSFILAHIGGGGDWAHTFPAVDDLPNVFLELSGSGVDRGMLDDAYHAVGAARLIWGSDITMETGLAKLRALPMVGLTEEEIRAVTSGNAARIFPEESLSGSSRRGELTESQTA
ncbi:MAG: amidohydrolase family protein [Gemmatimonadaceae bacterium]